MLYFRCISTRFQFLLPLFSGFLLYIFLISELLLMFHFFNSSCSVLGNDTAADDKQYPCNLFHCYQSMFLVNLAVCGRLAKFLKTHVFYNGTDKCSFVTFLCFFIFLSICVHNRCWVYFYCTLSTITFCFLYRCLIFYF